MPAFTAHIIVKYERLVVADNIGDAAAIARESMPFWYGDKCQLVQVLGRDATSHLAMDRLNGIKSIS